MTSEKLVYVGKIIQLDAIPNADFILVATVVCGSGGKWRGIVKRDDFSIGDICIVYLPDSIIPPSEEMKFMERSGWRVRMRRFKGAPSEVLIMPIKNEKEMGIGDDLTAYYGVTKYIKAIPPHLNGIAKGDFPSFIPKTDEPNYQTSPHLVDNLIGKPYYITEKADGASTTAYKHNGEFGLCSRNLELVHNPHNGYWRVALKYQLDKKLPDDLTVQWETCGNGIQSNPMGLKDIDGFLFSAFDIKNHKYLEFDDLNALCKEIKFPMVKILDHGDTFNAASLELLGEGKYSNGAHREGVVVRSKQNNGHAPISFKIINLNYE